MLGTAVKVTGKQFPRIAKLAERCADTLRIPMPTLYVSPNIGSLNAHTFGTAEDPYVVLNAALVDHLSEPELLDVIGHECGHIQNNHVVYMTTLHFLTHAANMFLRWSVRPAVLALNAWARRAEITCDRAGLICTRSLDVSIGCLVKLALGSHKLYSDVNLDEYLAQLDEAQDGLGRLDELRARTRICPSGWRRCGCSPRPTYFRGRRHGTGGAAPVGGAAGGNVEGGVRRAGRASCWRCSMTQADCGMRWTPNARPPSAACWPIWRRWRTRRGWPASARDIRDTRLPKLDDERFSLVVLGEFNHGKSTFINALLGAPVLPTGITPTTARAGPRHARRARRPRRWSGECRRARAPIAAAPRSRDWLTVEGNATARNGRPKATAARIVHHVEITHPVAAAENRLTIVDTPGRQRHQRAARRHHLRLPAARRRRRVPARRDPDPDRVGAAVPRGADPALDARSADVRGRQGRSARRRPSWPRRCASRASTWRRSSPSRRSSRCRRSARWPAIATGRGMDAFVAALGATVGARAAQAAARPRAGRRGRAVGVHPPEPGACTAGRWSCRWPSWSSGSRARRSGCSTGKKVLDTAAETVRAETAALKARVRQDLADFAAELRDGAGRRRSTTVDAADIRRYLSLLRAGHLEGVGRGGGRAHRRGAGAAGREGHPGGQRERPRGRPTASRRSSGPRRHEGRHQGRHAQVRRLGVRARRARHHGLPVRQRAGRRRAHAGGADAGVRAARARRPARSRPRRRSRRRWRSTAWRRCSAPKLDEIIDGFGGAAARSSSPQAGDALARGISEVLDRALRERRAARRRGHTPRRRQRHRRRACASCKGDRRAHRRDPPARLDDRDADPRRPRRTERAVWASSTASPGRSTS